MIEASGVTTARHDDDPETEGAQSTPNMIAVAVSIRTVTLTMAGLVKPISGVGTRSHTRTSQRLAGRHAGGHAPVRQNTST